MSLFIFRNARSLKEPDSSVDLWAVVSVILFSFGIFLMSSRFVLPPGVHVELPRATNISTSKINGILTIQSSNMLLFNGRIFGIPDLADELKFFMKNNAKESVVILIRPDKTLTLGEFIHICEILRSSGVNEIHVAAEKLHPIS